VDFFIITLNNRDFKHSLYQFASEFCFAFLKRLIFYFKSLRFKTFSYLLIHHCSSSRSNKSNENNKSKIKDELKNIDKDNIKKRVELEKKYNAVSKVLKKSRSIL
jgi:hypothetical protein